MEVFQKFTEYLPEPFWEWDLQYRTHATKRMFQRDIGEIDILETLENGKIIEN
jgi:hypothetical protein